MTDREKLQIEYYLPNPPDPELDLMEYFVEDMRGRAVKVTFSNIGFDNQGEEILQCRDTSGHLVHGPYECEPGLFGGGWYHKGALYDNKEDCKASSHIMCGYWEKLREIQKKEGLI